VTRLIQLLRAHGLVAKVPRTRRYRITAAGERLMGAAVTVKERHLPAAIHAAA
jgi:DNA-binding IclR family transcriptional regulator